MAHYEGDYLKKDGCHKEESCSRKLDLRGAFNRETTSILTFPSKNAGLSYVVYIFGDLAAELFSRDGNNFTSVATIPVDPVFSIVVSGDVSKDFKNFYIAEVSGLGNAVRIRRFGPGLAATPSFVIFNDVSPFTDVNIALTADNKYLILTYTPSTAPFPPAAAFIRVLDALTLQEVFPATVAEAQVFGPGGLETFSLIRSEEKKKHCKKEKRRNYIAVVTEALIAGGAGVAPPFALTIYSLHKTGLKLVSRRPLPAAGTVTATQGDQREAWLAVGTRVTFLSPTQPSVFPPAFVAANQTALPGDNNNFRVYSFIGGDSLHVIYLEAFPAGIQNPVIHPSRDYIFVSSTTIGPIGVPIGALGFLRCVKVCKIKEHHCEKQTATIDASKQNTTPIILPSFSAQTGRFSANGKWFNTGGSSAVRAGVRNVNFYKVAPREDPCDRVICLGADPVVVLTAAVAVKAVKTGERKGPSCVDV